MMKRVRRRTTMSRPFLRLSADVCVRPALQISSLGPVRREEEEVVMPQAVLNNPMGVKLVSRGGLLCQ